MTIARRYGEDPANYQHLQRASFKIVPHHVFEYGAEREDVVPPLPGTQATSLTVRPARARDWNAIWPFMRPIIAGGDTFSWDRDTSEEDARAAWMHEPPGRTFVAVGTRGQIIGTAEMEPNHGGPGAHVATAGFMVDPSYEGHGAGRALCQHVLEQARADGYRAIQFNAVAETNTRAVKLWRSLGFTVLVRIPEAFAHPDHGDVALLIMHQKLQPSGQSQEGDGPQPAPTWTSPAK
jgi:ribosomal protein S18 acetylase RimI-like enzyme